jgi:hypothetical protein
VSRLPRGTRLRVIDADRHGPGFPPFRLGQTVTVARTVDAHAPDTPIPLVEHRGDWKWLRFEPLEAMQ